MRHAVSIALVALVALVVGCGGSPAPSSNLPKSSTTPGTSGGSDANSVKKEGVGGGDSDHDGIPDTPDKMIVDDLARAQKTFDDSNASFLSASGDCASLCKALGSMQRAADHLCELTKGGADSDKKRCTDAQTKLDGAKERVKSTCGGGCGS